MIIILYFILQINFIERIKTMIAVKNTVDIHHESCHCPIRFILATL